ncbi:MAG: hypothetical protein NTV68_15140 [Methanomicrobiales archaeon]|nr:hypothetical protein [Methanomicrobiales archaeon]
MHPKSLSTIVNGKRYRSDSACLIASDAYWDGRNWERHGRNTFLFKTLKGNFFVQYQSKRRGEQDFIKSLSVEEAVQLYESLPQKEVEFAIAFPDLDIEDA